jgi:hypothetical protein
MVKDRALTMPRPRLQRAATARQEKIQLPIVTSLTGTFTRSYMRLEGALDLVAAHIGHGDGRVVNTLIPARAHALYTRRWSQQPKMV